MQSTAIVSIISPLTCASPHFTYDQLGLAPFSGRARKLSLRLLALVSITFILWFRPSLPAGFFQSRPAFCSQASCSEPSQKSHGFNSRLSTFHDFSFRPRPVLSVSFRLWLLAVSRYQFTSLHLTISLAWRCVLILWFRPSVLSPASSGSFGFIPNLASCDEPSKESYASTHDHQPCMAMGLLAGLIRFSRLRSDSGFLQ